MKAVKKIVSWLLVLIIFIVSIVLTITLIIKQNFNEEKIVGYLKENDFSFILKTKNGEYSKVMEDVEEGLKKIGIPSSTIEEVINSEQTKEYMGKFMFDIVDFVIYDKPLPTIKQEDFEKLVEENFVVIEKTLDKTGQRFTEEQKNHIMSLVSESKSHIMDLFPEAQKMLNKLNKEDIVLYNNITLKDITDLIAFLTSNKWTYILIGIILITMICLLFINIKTRTYLYYYRASLIIYAFFLIFLEIILGTVVKTKFMTSWESANVFMNYIINALSKNIGIFLIVALVIILIWSILIYYFKQKEWIKVKQKIIDEKK